MKTTNKTNNKRMVALGDKHSALLQQVAIKLNMSNRMAMQFVIFKAYSLSSVQRFNRSVSASKPAMHISLDFNKDQKIALTTYLNSSGYKFFSIIARLAIEKVAKDIGTYDLHLEIQKFRGQ